MSIKNINILQNPIDLAYITSYSNEYLIQSLANLGQRLGIKGDSIIYNYFTFLDIYDNIDTSVYNTGSYHGVILYQEDINDPNKTNCNFGIVDNNKLNTHITKENFSNTIIPSSYIKETNTFATQTVDNELIFDVIINNINKFKYSSFIYDKKYLNSLLYGNILNTNEYENNNIEIIYNKYNTDNGILEYCIRVFWLYNIGNSNYYCMMVQEPYIDNIYKLTFYLFNSSLISSEKTKQEFEDCFNYTNLSKNNYFFLDSNDISNFDDLFNYEDDNNCTLFGLIKYNKLNNEINGSLNNYIYIKLDTNENVYFTLDENNINNNIIYVNDILNKQNSNLLNRIAYLNNDIIYLYPKLIEFYSSNIYKKNKSNITKFTLKKIYEYLYNDEILADEENIKKYSVFYIPLDYRFKYYCNSSDETNIYNSLDIYITLNNLSLYTNNKFKEFILQNKTPLYSINKIDIEKIINIQYNYDYDKKYNEYILNLNINKIYTLPYINQSNNWSINDINSQISAIGKNAGNPNIIILYNYKNDKEDEISSSIICPYNISVLESSLEYEKSLFYIDPNIVKDSINHNVVECYASLPKITKDSIEYLSDSIIILITDQSCIKTKDVIINENNNLNYISTIWMINPSIENNLNNYSQFECVTKSFINNTNTNIAFDISSLLNIDNIISNLVINTLNNEHAFNKILLNTNVSELKQESDISKNTKGILKNESYSHYIENIKGVLKNTQQNDIINVLNEYKNSLSLSIKYNSNVLYDSTTYSYTLSTSDNKYINYDFNNKCFNNKVVNSLYPLLVESDTTYKTSYSYVYQLGWVDNSTYNAYSYIVSDNNIEESINFIVTYEKYSNVPQYKNVAYSYETIEIETSEHDYNIGYNNNYFHNEYTFATDIPQLDLKEIFVVNSNVLNRQNILTVEHLDNNTCKIYNSYIGSSFDINSNKQKFVIGSSKNNINIGTETLINNIDTLKFDIQDTIDINFKNINLNGVANTNLNNIIHKHNIKSYNNNNITYYVFEYDGLGNLGHNLNYEDNGNDLFSIYFTNNDEQILQKNNLTQTQTNLTNAKKIINLINTDTEKNNYNLFTLKYNQGTVNTQEKRDYKDYEFIRLSFVPFESEFFKEYFGVSDNILWNMHIPFMNINKILDNIFYDIYGSTLTELSKNNDIHISQKVNKFTKYMDTLNDYIEIYNPIDNKNVICIEEQDDSTTYISELLCNNFGDLIYAPNNDKELYNKQNICLYDKIKFVFYKEKNNYYIEIIGNKAPIFDKFTIS